MASLKWKLLSSLAAVCAAGSPSAADTGAAELLRTAQAAADRIAPCPAVADDLASEAVLRILRRHREVLDFDDSRRRAYVRSSVKNAYWDELRKQKHLLRLYDPGVDEPNGDDVWTPAVVDDEPEVVEAEEFRAELSPGDREVLELLEDGCTDRRIATLTQRTRHDVRQSVKRIRRRAESFFGAALSSRAS